MSDLVCHLDSNVLAALADLHLVHDVGDRFHGVTHVSIAELLLGRNQTDALLEQLALSDRSIGEVSEHARSHVDDDVRHVRMFVYELEEPTKLRALLDGLS
nr:hypothetical protein [Microbacterium testaceum]